MKFVFLLTALAAFMVLSDFTYPAQREEFSQDVEKPDFTFKDFVHGTTMSGSLVNKDDKVQVEIKSVRIDMKIVYEFTEKKGSAQVYSTPNNRTPNNRTLNNRTPEQEEVHEFADSSQFPHNATCPAQETIGPRLPSLATRAWDYTVTMTKRILNKCYDIVKTMVNGVWNGAVWLAECTWNGVRVLMEWAWDTAKWIWNGVKILMEWAWDTAKWLAEWIWGKFLPIAELAWNGAGWIGRPLMNAFNYVTEVVGEFYDEYLESHVRAVQAQIDVLTWKDVLYILVAVTVVNSVLFTVYLLVKFTVSFILRKWQAWKERKAAANAPPAPKKPIWRPKPKKKKRNNKNSW